MIREFAALTIALGAAALIASGVSQRGGTTSTDGRLEVATATTPLTARAQQADKPAAQPSGIAAAAPFPTNIGGNFTLIDQTGRTRRPGSFDGKPIVLFFGYAKCEAICTVALPRMAEMVDLLAARNLPVTPVMITVDRKRDTPAAMRDALPKHHRDFIGLTGTQAALDEAASAFQVESKVVYVTPDGEDIFAHGNYIYLMGADGAFMTLFPPILGPERMAAIAEKYLRKPPA